MTTTPSTPTAPTYTPSLYVDVAELIARGPVKPPAPTIGRRTDGNGLFYLGHVNSIMGDPECGKTLAMLAVAAECLYTDQSVLIIDLDHNGAQATVGRLMAMGLRNDRLGDPEKFRFAEPETQDDMIGLVRDVRAWGPTLVVIDSVGELLPLYGANSNSPDDFTRVHSAVIKPMAVETTAVVLIDHLAKGVDSRSYGASGTAAKKRAISGVSLRASLVDAFTPGHGGRSELTINKDRHGGLRAVSPTGEKEPLAAKFVLTDHDGALDWKFYAPDPGETASTQTAPQEDIEALAQLDPPPTTIEDARGRLRWGKPRAITAMQQWRAAGSPSGQVPGPTPGVRTSDLSQVPGPGPHWDLGPHAQVPGPDPRSRTSDLSQNDDDDDPDRAVPGSVPPVPEPGTAPAGDACSICGNPLWAPQSRARGHCDKCAHALTPTPKPVPGSPELKSA